MGIITTTAPLISGGGCGTIFKITPAGTLSTLHGFCSQNGCADGGCTDGGGPWALVQGTDGNFYGTTTGYGGTIFKITPGGTLTTLFTFCPKNACTDGQCPYDAPLVQDTNGTFYGTTSAGGNGYGTVFRLGVGLWARL